MELSRIRVRAWI